MGFKDSRLGKIIEVLAGFGRSFANWLRTPDDIDALSVVDAVAVVNKEAETEEDKIDDKVVKAMRIAAELNKDEAARIFDRGEAVGPVFSAAEGESKENTVEDPTVALNRALEDDTMRYVNGNPVELKPVDKGQTLGKGGKERERTR